MATVVCCNWAVIPETAANTDHEATGGKYDAQKYLFQTVFFYMRTRIEKPQAFEQAG